MILGYLHPITNHLTSARHLTTAGHSHLEFECLVTAPLSLNDGNMIIRSFNRKFGVASVLSCQQIGLSKNDRRSERSERTITYRYICIWLFCAGPWVLYPSIYNDICSRLTRCCTSTIAGCYLYRGESSPDVGLRT